MRYQAQSFVKQVQIDLLALSDADLFHEIDQWGPRKEPSILSQDAQEVTWTALGFTRTPPETEHLSRPPGVELEVRATHPEWGDGSTFNAHLANHLRWIRMNRRRNDQSTMRTPHV